MLSMADAATKSTALWVVRRLRRAGFEALLAGGCVRDTLLGRRSDDYDVATDATPRQVKRLFGHVLLIGAKFGVAVVLRDKRKVEVATFRSDLSYSDGRRPDGVRFSSPEEDARRRDFTINGMFYDPLAGEVIDYVGGRRDLAGRVIRTIGNPDERFAEDYLRMLRAVRFAVRLDFAVAPATAAAIRRHAHRIVAISGERIFDELSKMLSAPSAGRALGLMGELRLLRHVLGEVCEVPGMADAARQRVGAVARRKDLTLAMGALLGDLPRRTIASMIRRWGASNDLCGALQWLAAHADDWRDVGRMSLAEFRRLAGHGQFPRLRVLWRLRERAECGRERCARLAGRRLREIPDGVALPAPLVKGADLLEMGLCEGTRLGGVLREAYEAQLNGRLRSRGQAMAWLRDRLGRP